MLFIEFTYECFRFFLVVRKPLPVLSEVCYWEDFPVCADAPEQGDDFLGGDAAATV